MTTVDVFTVIQQYFNDECLGVCSLGRTAENCYKKLPNSQILYIDCMGCITDVAVGVALGCPQKRVFSFDTDGSFLFNSATIHSLAEMEPSLGNLNVLIFDNQILESGGGAKSRCVSLNWDSLFAAWGLKIIHIDTIDKLQNSLTTCFENKLSIFILDINNDSLSNSCNKDIDGIESRYMFKRTISNQKGGTIHPCVKN